MSHPHPPREGDLPLGKAVEMADELATKGHQVFFKVTCPNCGQRLTFEEPFTAYTSVHCDACLMTSDVDHYGLFVVMNGLRV